MVCLEYLEGCVLTDSSCPEGPHLPYTGAAGDQVPEALSERAWRAPPNGRAQGEGLRPCSPWLMAESVPTPWTSVRASRLACRSFSPFP